MAFELKTGRGPYRLELAKPPESVPGATLLTLSLERLDGIERIALLCSIDVALVSAMDSQGILARLAPWIERDFEMTRENALKSIRSERRLMEIVFDAEHRGPF